MNELKGVVIGAGYFSAFHQEAWTRIPEVHITAVCDLNKEKADSMMRQFHVPRYYADYREMVTKERPDFVDIITPPGTHAGMCRFLADQSVSMVCQKPLAPTFEEAKAIVQHSRDRNVRFMVHENWRFQPWYREIKKILERNAIGKLHTLVFRSRMGDGWGAAAYLNRQPYFREYPRLLVYENGIHFIDTFRFLAGEIRRVYARLRRLNPVIAGEDWAMVHFEFEKEVIGLWDANRYNEPNWPNPRYTFGEFLLDGTLGTIRLSGDGKLTLQPLGKPEREHAYDRPTVNFAGDCVHATQRHFIDCLIGGQEFETNGKEYLRSLAVQEAVYESAELKFPVGVMNDESIFGSLP